MTDAPRVWATTAFRLALAYAAAFALIAIATAAYAIWRTGEAGRAEIERTLGEEVATLRAHYDRSGLPRLREVVAERAAAPGPSLYLLLDAEGMKLAGNLTHRPAELSGQSTRGVFRYMGDTVKPGRLAAGVALAVPGGPVLIVGHDIESTRRMVDHVRQIFLGGLGLLALLGIGGGLILGRRLLRRVDTMTAASRAIMAGDLSGRLPRTESNDELDRLAAGLNDMLARIDTLMTELRQVTDNIAHDLRTPLNRLRLGAEAALADPRGSEAWREGLERTIREADAVIGVFNALLSIARLEAGALAGEAKPLDAAAAARDVVELYEPLAEEQGVALVVAAPGPAMIRGHRELIGQAVANLIDNALKYGAGAPNGRGRADRIEVAVARREGSIEIAVADNGPGIPAADRARVLGRFVRLEASRSKPGSGLGLSLVAAVARVHGGSLELEDNAPGLRVILRLPAADAGPVESRKDKGSGGAA